MLQRTLLLSLLVLFPLFFIGGTDATSTRTMIEVWNLGHFIFFALLTQTIFLTLKNTSYIFKTLLCISLTATAGAGIEILQYLFTADRLFSFTDFLMDLLGCFAALTLLQLQKKFSYFQAIIFALMLGIAFFPLLRAGLDDYRMHHDFPILSPATTQLELSRWQEPEQMEIIRDSAIASYPVIKLNLPPTLYSGATLAHFPKDWSTYKYLVFSIYTPVADSLEYKVYDQRNLTEPSYKNRFNGSAKLKPGWNTITTPLSVIKTGPTSAPLDISKIQGFSIFFNNEKDKNLQKREIYLGPVYLTP